MISRRHLLGVTGLGTVALGMGLMVSGEASARVRASQPVPHRQRGILRPQPPYKYSEDRYKKRLGKTRNKTRLKSRSARAKGTLNTPGNRRALALTMWGEARGYGTLGMRCVGHVIMNRVKANKKRFGYGVSGVCYKRKQFSCHNPKDPNQLTMTKLPTMDESNPDWIAFMKADKLAGEILAGIDKDNTGGATFYAVDSMVPYWSDDMVIIGVMFGHIFYKEKPRSQRKKNRKKRHHCLSHDSHHKKRAKHHYDHSHTSHH